MIKEPILESVIRKKRFELIVNEINVIRSHTLVDIGCGPKIEFYRFAQKRGVLIKKYIGIDPLLKSFCPHTSKVDSQVELISKAIEEKIPLKNNFADVVVGSAVLEHLKNPKGVIKETIRVLKNGGVAVFTTPTPRAKRLLEFLAYRLGVISKREIMEHKQYFKKEDLLGLLAPFRNIIEVRHRYFEFGMNNLLTIKKCL